MSEQQIETKVVGYVNEIDKLSDCGQILIDKAILKEMAEEIKYQNRIIRNIRENLNQKLEETKNLTQLLSETIEKMRAVNHRYEEFAITKN